jgi:PHD/YefM family antitoxin component YafN of YafNO toxin-antitoxin module
MLLETNQMIPVTKLQRELTKKVREISETGDALYIMKNNKMEAVMIPFEEYEHLHHLDEIFEEMEIKSMIESRLKDYDRQGNISWDEIRED